MSNFERQIQETEYKCDQAMQALESEPVEILRSDMSGSRLHAIINNPVTEGIDEG